jgi:hypothetical protein
MWIATIQVFLVELVICYRLYAIYNGDKRILFGFLFLLLLTIAGSSAVIGIVIKGGHGQSFLFVVVVLFK